MNTAAPPFRQDGSKMFLACEVAFPLVSPAAGDAGGGLCGLLKRHKAHQAMKVIC